MPAFIELSKAAMKPGALDFKTKELIAAAVGLAARCEYCIVHHVYSWGYSPGAYRDGVRN
jgi:alkylhydroperoxidase/carboxymuconolactone decarboxylase family protein YurZ